MYTKRFFLSIFIIIFVSTHPASAEVNLTELVKKIQPAVVTIITYDMDNKVSNLGSGFFIDRKGHLITNYHVLEGKYAAEVRTQKGEKYPIRSVVAENKTLDLVKVRVEIPEDSISWISVSRNMPLIAERVLVVGSPLGLEQTVSEGIVSAVRDIPELGSFFQTTAPISPGSSGSPVVNMMGDVIGVVSFQLLMGQNLNFAVSGPGILELKHEKIQQALSEWAYGINVGKPKLAEELCRKGFNFSINGEHKKAIQYYKEATEKDPDNTIAWYGLGSCYVGLNKPNEVINTYKAAIRINSDDALLHFNLGKYYDKLGRYKEAVKAYKQAIRINPDAAFAHDKLGLTQSKLGFFKDALIAHKQVVRINPFYAPGYYNIGVTYGKLGKPEKAIEAYQQAIQLNPNLAPAHNNMGILYGELGRHNEEIEAFKNAIRISPDDANAHYHIGYAFLSTGDKAGALDEYKILKGLDQEKADQLFDRIYR